MLQSCSCLLQKITILFSQTAKLVSEKNEVFIRPYQMTRQQVNESAAGYL
jgi:hypothetical protein